MSQQTTPVSEGLTRESGVPESPQSRGRRWMVVGPLAVIAVVGAGASVGCLREGGDEASLSASSHAPYPVDEMPARMSSALQHVLTKHGLRPGPMTFFAGDSDFAEVSSDNYASARFMYSETAVGNHTWRLYTGAQIDGVADPKTGCPPDFPSTLLCTIDPQPDGSITEERVMVSELNPASGNFRLTDASTLDPDDLGDVRIEHSWSVFRNGNKTTLVETVMGPAVLGTKRPFDTTGSDWEGALADGALVLRAD